MTYASGGSGPCSVALIAERCTGGRSLTPLCVRLRCMCSLSCAAQKWASEFEGGGAGPQEWASEFEASQKPGAGWAEEFQTAEQEQAAASGAQTLRGIQAPQPWVPRGGGGGGGLLLVLGA